MCCQRWRLLFLEGRRLLLKRRIQSIGLEPRYPSVFFHQRRASTSLGYLFWLWQRRRTEGCRLALIMTTPRSLQSALWTCQVMNDLRAMLPVRSRPRQQSYLLPGARSLTPRLNKRRFRELVAMCRSRSSMTTLVAVRPRAIRQNERGARNCHEVRIDIAEPRLQVGMRPHLNPAKHPAVRDKRSVYPPFCRAEYRRSL